MVVSPWGFQTSRCLEALVKRASVSTTVGPAVGLDMATDTCPIAGRGVSYPPTRGRPRVSAAERWSKRAELRRAKGQTQVVTPAPITIKGRRLVVSISRPYAMGRPRDASIILTGF